MRGHHLLAKPVCTALLLSAAFPQTLATLLPSAHIWDDSRVWVSPHLLLAPPHSRKRASLDTLAPRRMRQCITTNTSSWLMIRVASRSNGFVSSSRVGLWFESSVSMLGDLPNYHESNYWRKEHIWICKCAQLGFLGCLGEHAYIWWVDAVRTWLGYGKKKKK